MNRRFYWYCESKMTKTVWKIDEQIHIRIEQCDVLCVHNCVLDLYLRECWQSCIEMPFHIKHSRIRPTDSVVCKSKFERNILRINWGMREQEARVFVWMRLCWSTNLLKNQNNTKCIAEHLRSNVVLVYRSSTQSNAALKALCEFAETS